MDVKLPDGHVVKNVPDGMSQIDLLGHLQRANHPSVPALMRQMAGEEATRDSSGLQKFFAGMGKSVADTGLGIRQLTGFADQQEVDEVKQRDSALMNTGAGMGGNVSGHVMQALIPGLGATAAGKAVAAPALANAGRYMLASPISLGGAATQAGLGGAQALLQPVATGESRAVNTGIGAASGAAIPLAGMALRGGRALVEPFYKGGRANIAGRVIADAAGDNAPQVSQRLSSARELVPGSAPTAAEVGESGGLAALQRSAAAVDPEGFATRAAQQDEARTAALQGITGTQAQRDAAIAARESGAGALYDQARREGLDLGMADALKPQIQNLWERVPSGVMENAKELARLNSAVMGRQGSVEGLHWLKLGVDEQLKHAKPGTPLHRALTVYKDDLLSVVDELSPAYAQGRQTYQKMSRPVNQMATAREIEQQAANPLTGSLRAQAYARALSDDTAKSATGFNRATLADTFDPSQLASLEAIKKDLARSVQARDLGRGAGSDTVQKLSMSNVARQAGIPRALLNLPGVGKVSSFAYEGADDEIRKLLAKALLSPKETAKLMNKAQTSPQAQKAAMLLRSMSPAVGAASPALVAAE